MSKRFGQNFLVNRNARERILEAALKVAGIEAAAAPTAVAAAGADVAAPQQGAAPAAPAAPAVPSAPAASAAGQGRVAGRAWEIGPGIGSMTELALDAGLRVSAFEIDHGFARLLCRLFGERPEFHLVEGDFLKTWRAELEAKGPPDFIFGNLPYNVAAAIVAVLIEGFAEAGIAPLPMAFTVQKEAALRMAAKPGTEDYSAFSVLCTSACKVKLAFDVGASSFWPVPRVTSTLVTMAPRKDPIGATDRKAYSFFCRASFSSRRKTIKNNLRAAGWADADVAAALEKLGLSPSVRAEVLSPENLEALMLALPPRAGLANSGRGSL